MQPPDQSCELCRFFELTNAPEDRGWCMRLPPAVVFFPTDKDPIYQLSRYPDVKLDWWCGEFKATA